MSNLMNEACWEGYKQVGMKEKNGKMVPNCVPVKEEATYNDMKVELGKVYEDPRINAFAPQVNEKLKGDQSKIDANKDGKITAKDFEILRGEDDEVDEYCAACLAEVMVEAKSCGYLEEAEYRGRKVKLNKPMRGDVKKFKVFVKDPKTGNVKKINFGDPKMKIKKSNPKRRKSFRARHKCDTAKDKTTARYWSCRKW